MIALEPLLRARVTVDPARELGDTPRGRRRIIAITGGSFSGARLSGRVLPGGADWQIVRADGVAFLDARYMLETNDGALIHVENRGYRHGPREVMERLARGERADPALYYMRTTPWFETSDARYGWLNRIICVGTGARLPDAVELEFFEVK